MTTDLAETIERWRRFPHLLNDKVTLIDTADLADLLDAAEAGVRARDAAPTYTIPTASVPMVPNGEVKHLTATYTPFPLSADAIRDAALEEAAEMVDGFADDSIAILQDELRATASAIRALRRPT